jgi:hypothetical protein
VQKKHLERWWGVAGAGLNENKMPLVRYEVRSEHRLAKPELYRAAAARDDSKALLEGVAVAGLIGIVRQLGDLAEYVNTLFPPPKTPFFFLLCRLAGSSSPSSLHKSSQNLLAFTCSSFLLFYAPLINPSIIIIFFLFCPAPWVDLQSANTNVWKKSILSVTKSSSCKHRS